MKKKRLIGLGILLIFQLSFPLYFIFLKEGIHQKGKEYLFAIDPVDPYDFFQGKYVSLNTKTLAFKGKNAHEFKRKDVVYVTLKQTPSGAIIEGVSKEASTYSIKLLVNRTEGKTLLFKLPFERFYTEESKAKHIEKTISGFNNRDSIQPFVHVKIYRGDFVITDISKNGKSLVSRQ